MYEERRDDDADTAGEEVDEVMLKPDCDNLEASGMSCKEGLIPSKDGGISEERREPEYELAGVLDPRRECASAVETLKVDPDRTMPNRH